MCSSGRYCPAGAVSSVSRVKRRLAETCAVIPEHSSGESESIRMHKTKLRS